MSGGGAVYCSAEAIPGSAAILQQPDETHPAVPVGSSAAAGGGKVKALRKRRKDLGAVNPQRTSSRKGGASTTGISKQPFRRRCARARWAALMFLPALSVLVYRHAMVEEATGVSLAAMLAASILVVSAAVLNELLDLGPRAVYVSCFIGAFAWGGAIDATRDLIAMRLASMVVLGLCSGMLRYHWGDEGHKQQNRTSPGSLQLSATPGSLASPKPKSPVVPGGSFDPAAVDDYSSSSTAYMSTDTGNNNNHHHNGVLHAPSVLSGGPVGRSDTTALQQGVSNPLGGPLAIPQHPATAPPPSFHSQPPPSQITLEIVLSRLFDFALFLRSHVGLGITAAVGETLGCAILVPTWGEVVSVSWIGYLAVIVVPVVIYKFSSWTSHVLVLLFGSRVNTADASRLLLLYWVITTVLGIGIFFFTVAWLVTNIVTFVWSLQLLTTPYAVFFELVAYESRKSQAVNPYNDIAEQYDEHITSIRNAKESYLS